MFDGYEEIVKWLEHTLLSKQRSLKKSRHFFYAEALACALDLNA